MKRTIMKPFKKLTAALAAITMLLASSVPASADVIYEPEDTFYEEHRDECQLNYLSYGYEISCKDEKLKLFKSPVNAEVVDTMNKGDSCWSNTFYTDENGVTWAYIEKRSGATWIGGWVDTGCLFRRYDSELFVNDHINEVKGIDGTWSDPDYSAFGPLIPYDYPNAPTCRLETGTVIQGDFNAQKFYTDELGRNWGYCSYYIGIRDFWFSMDKPDALPDELYKDGMLYPDTRVKEEVEQIVPANGKLPGNVMMLLITLVGSIGGMAVFVLILLLIGNIQKKKAAR